MPEQLRSIAWRYGLSLAIVGLAIVLRLWLEPYLEKTGFAIFLAGILSAAWIGGVGPALLGQTFILLAEALFFNKTPGPPPTPLRFIVNISAFYLVGLTVGILSEAMHAANRRARAQKNEALSQREQLGATLSCMGDGVLVTDTLGRVTLMNPVAEMMTGWTVLETQGKLLSEVFSVRDEASHQLLDNPFERILREEIVHHVNTPLILTTKNGGELPIAYSCAPIRGADGEITGVVLVFRNETERRQTELALRNADRKKDEFLATLAHELRNPLAPVCMGLQVMKMSAHDSGVLQEILPMMERQTQHMVRLIEDLLDVSRITRGKLELRKSRVELAEIVQNAMEATRPLIEEAGHYVQIHIPETPVVLYADSNRLTQVLSNLLNNAAKYTSPGGRIEVVAEHTGPELLISVSDSGIGIPQEMIGSIFEMFTQINGSIESGHSGIGIGLTLVKRLIEMHGGTIQVESLGKNLGTTFRLRLPVVLQIPESEMAPAPIAEVESTDAPLRVLLVDDNQDALTTLSKMIAFLGHEICLAEDGIQALEAAKAFRPDVVLMDLGMPNMNGYEAARQLRSEPWGRDVVLVATTGWGQEEDRRRTKEAGFDQHLVKPIELGGLQVLLKNASTRLAGKDAAATSRVENTTSNGAAFPLEREPVGATIR